MKVGLHEIRAAVPDTTASGACRCNNWDTARAVPAQAEAMCLRWDFQVPSLVATTTLQPLMAENTGGEAGPVETGTSLSGSASAEMAR